MSLTADITQRERSISFVDHVEPWAADFDYREVVLRNEAQRVDVNFGACHREPLSDDRREVPMLRVG